MTLEHLYAIIHMLHQTKEETLKRTTIFANEETLTALRAIARERGLSLAEAVRQALAAFVAKHRRRRKPLSIIGIGRSGRKNVADRAEEFLRKSFGR